MCWSQRSSVSVGRPDRSRDQHTKEGRGVVESEYWWSSYRDAVCLHNKTFIRTRLQMFTNSKHHKSAQVTLTMTDSPYPTLTSKQRFLSESTRNGMLSCQLWVNVRYMEHALENHLQCPMWQNTNSKQSTDNHHFYKVIMLCTGQYKWSFFS